MFGYVRECLERFGESPKLIEIASHFGFSIPRAWKVVDALVQQGRLKKAIGHKVKLVTTAVDLSTVGTEALRAELARRGETFDALERPRVDRGRPCAANRCSVLVQPGKLMCFRHWSQLPQRYRTDILRAWSARQMQAYGEALERARNYLGGFSVVAERMG